MPYEPTEMYTIDYSTSTAGLSAVGLSAAGAAAAGGAVAAAGGGAEAGTGFKASSILSIGTNGM